MGDYDGTYGTLMGGEGASSGNNWFFYKNPKPSKLNSHDGRYCGLPRYAGSEDPFMDEAEGDFRVKPASVFTGISPIGKAFDVGAPYNVDMNGVQHSNIGAYATVAEGTPKPTLVAAPTPTPVPNGAPVRLHPSNSNYVEFNGQITPLIGTSILVINNGRIQMRWRAIMLRGWQKLKRTG